MLQIHLILPNLSELRNIVSRLSHIADDVKISANLVGSLLLFAVSRAHDLPGWDYGSSCSRFQAESQYDMDRASHSCIYRRAATPFATLGKIADTTFRSRL